MYHYSVIILSMQTNAALNLSLFEMNLWLHIWEYLEADKVSFLFIFFLRVYNWNPLGDNDT